METCIINSPLGYTKIVGDIDGVSSVTVLNSKEKVTDIIPEILEDCVIQLNEYFEDSREQFSLKLNPQGTDFQKKVWKALVAVEFGHLATYGDIAKALGKPGAARAVGGANNANPIPIIVPCHRIIGSDQSLTGFGGGLPTKQFLLDHEAKYAVIEGRLI